MANFVLPAIERIIACNARVLEEFPVKKADKAEILARQKLVAVLEEATSCEGDVYDVAIVLLRGITKAHAFASGNRRTAVLVTKEFLLQNGGTFAIPDDPNNARVLQGVREDFYSTDDLKAWLQTGDIHEFTR